MNILKMINDEITDIGTRYASKYECTPPEISVAVQFAVIDNAVYPFYKVLKNGEPQQDEPIELDVMMDLGMDFMGKGAIVNNYMGMRYMAMHQALNTQDIYIVIDTAPILFKVYVNDVEYCKSLDFSYNALACLKRYAEVFKDQIEAERLAKELKQANPVEAVSLLVDFYNDNCFYKVCINYKPVLNPEGRHRYFSITELMDIKFEFIEAEADNINEYLKKKLMQLKFDDYVQPSLLIVKNKKGEGVICHAYDGTVHKEILKLK